ncbi:MAG: DNA repair protein RecN [Terriglobia bacterium]|nr:DNA repair protein RecN [Terriglobia bacterium]
MLLELRVENYAVIDNVVVEFGPGLNLLTGETGAGKSILIDALALLLGEKASTDVIRHGSDRAIITAVFEADSRPLCEALEANGLDSDADQVILRREILSTGKARVFVNNQPATVAVLKQLAPHLAIVHAQNESMMAFDPPARLALLDTASGIDTAAVTNAFAEWNRIRQHIAELEQGEKDKLRLVDLWSFQLKEIDNAALHAGEDQKLESEKRVLANSERILNAALSAYDSLYDNAQSASATIAAAMRQLEDLARFDPKFQESISQIESARITVAEIGITLRDYSESIDASPERLAEVEDRLALIDRLRRKYGTTLEDVLTYADDLRRKLNEIENKDEVLRDLKKQLDKAAEMYLAEARTLSKKRYEVAHKLEKTVEAEVNDLAMKAKFKIDVSGSDEEGNWTSTGFDQVAYLISANLGEPLGAIEHIASGGELSRVMLALKASVEAGRGTKKSDHQRTLVFDEIDTGIGGRAAEAVGRKLKALSRTKQVLCITHLPQIASFADHHFLIAKKESAGRTRTTVLPLDGKERVEEIARMLSGARLTEASLKNAEQMLTQVAGKSLP